MSFSRKALETPFFKIVYISLYIRDYLGINYIVFIPKQAVYAIRRLI